MDTRTIKILKATVCGGLRVSPGDVVDASLGDARYLVNVKAAEPCEKPVVAEKPKAERKPKNKMVTTLETRA
jgi:hypothetical protein